MNYVTFHHLLPFFDFGLKASQQPQTPADGLREPGQEGGQEQRAAEAAEPLRGLTSPGLNEARIAGRQSRRRAERGPA